MLSTPQVHGHHSPGQVFHALRVGQRVPGLGIQLPDLGAEGVLSLQFFRRLAVRFAPCRRLKDAVPQRPPR